MYIFIVIAIVFALCASAGVCDVKYIGHRGVKALAPENTIISTQMAWDQGVDMSECDVWLTKDKKVIVSHDESTKRCTGVDLEIPKTDSAVLRELDAGKYKGEEFAGEKLPLLSELIQTIPPGRKLVVEIKCGPEIVPHMKKVVLKSGRADQIEVISFNLDSVTAFKKAMPGIPCLWLHGPDKDKDGNTVPYDLEWVKIARKNGLDGLDLRYNSTSTEIVDAAHAEGMIVYVYTVNDPVEAARLRVIGVDGITSDNPLTIRENNLRSRTNKLEPNNVRYISHRGGANLAPENTMTAYNLSLALNYKAIETDVWMSKDGRVMLIHDPTTKRTCGVNMNVIDTNSGELRKLDASWHKKDMFAPQQIPFLEELYAILPPDVDLILDVKDTRPEFFPVLEKVIRSSGRVSQTEFIVSSFDAAVALKKQMPDVSCTWSPGSRAMRFGPRVHFIPEYLDMIKANNLDGIITYDKAITADIVTLVRNAGIKIICGTCDDAKVGARNRALGVDSIISNNPNVVMPENYANTKAFPREKKYPYIAHRGGANLAPENTTASFTTGIALKYSCIETDVWLTADNRLAVIHDSSTKRTCGDDLKVKESNFADLEKMDAAWHKKDVFSPQRILSLEEMMKLLPADTGLVLDIKDWRSEIQPYIVKAIRESGMSSRITIITGYFDQAYAYKMRMPDVKVVWSPGTRKGADGGTIHYYPEWTRQTRDANLDGLIISSEAITKEIADEIHAAGLIIVSGTCDNPKDAARNRSLGVDMIISNNPNAIYADKAASKSHNPNVIY